MLPDHTYSRMPKKVLPILAEEYNVSRETIISMMEYQKLLISWNKKINLVSSSSLENFWERHILDSIQIIKYISNKDITLVDLGSGAGFPGVILSMLGVKNVILVDSDSRKSAFLLQVSQLSDNFIQVINDRIENLSLQCDIVTSRGLSTILSILDSTVNFTVKEKYLLLKSKNAASELNEASAKKKFNYNLYPSITSTDSWIVEVIL